MKKRILWLSLSFLLVASLLLVSCAKTTTPATVTSTAITTSTSTTTSTTTTTTTGTTPTTTSAVATGPVYGGKLTVTGYRTSLSPVSFDPSTTNTNADYYIDPYAEYLLAGDIDGLGPRGTNAYNFQQQGMVPPQDLTGQLATSWEQPDPLTLIFHIRQGVMWTGNSSIGMAPRPFTANDAAAELNRIWKGPNGGSNYYYFASFTATDASTLVIKMKTYSPDWYYRVGYGIKCEMIPPEEVAAPNGGALNWKNQVGTGPFILTDFVAGSYCSYTRNTNYWGSTTINGKQYQTPFIQTLVYPIITDDSSLTAAIRTAKVDLALGETETDKSSLPSTMTTFDYLKNNAYQVAFKCDSGIFSDVNVRRAMMIGTDLNAVAKAVYPLGAEINAMPISPGDTDIYTPISQMPASTAELFTYDPTTAQQMLAAAGYPSGFTIQIDTQTDPTQEDIAAVLASQWAKLNVTLTINPLPLATWTNDFLGHIYQNVFMASTGNADPVSCLQYKAIYGGYNISNYNDAKATSMFNQAIALTDPAARDAIFKQLTLYVIDQCEIIGMPAPDVFGAYWPWIQNYYKEVEAGYVNYVPIESRIWIDQGIKAKLGY